MDVLHLSGWYLVRKVTLESSIMGVHQPRTKPHVILTMCFCYLWPEPIKIMISLLARKQHVTTNQERQVIPQSILSRPNNFLNSLEEDIRYGDVSISLSP